MTREFIQRAIENTARKSTNNNSCLIISCIKKFHAYFTEDEIFEIIGKVNAEKPKRIYKSHFRLGN